MLVLVCAPAARIIMRDGRTTGVLLESGEEIAAKVVISNADPKRTFLTLTDPGQLPTDFVDEVQNFRTYSTGFKFELALEEPPKYTAFDAEAIGTRYPTYVHIGPSVDYLERAYDDAKYGHPSAEPFLSAVVPTIVEPGLAPPGKQLLSIFGGHAPYTLQGTTWNEEEKERLADNALDTLAAYAPNVKDAVIHRRILTPVDLESIFALPQGHISHGELSLNQLFFARPVPGYADYRSPIRGLYLCGAGTHPGGGVMGVCGYNAAREVLKDGIA